MRKDKVIGFSLGLALVLAISEMAFVPFGTGSSQTGIVTATDFVMDFEGYECFADFYTYEDWSALLKSCDISYYDYLEAENKPEQVLVVHYKSDDGVVGIWIEIHEYEKAEYAEAEYNLAKPSTGREESPIFKRFASNEWLFQKGRFLVFMFCSPGYGQPDYDRAASTLDGLLDDFVRNFIEIVSEEEVQSSPPPVDFSGKVVWGIRPGDVITWEYHSSSLYKSYSPRLITLEIVKISDDNLSVLIRIPRDKFEAYNQDGSYNIDHYVYRNYKPLLNIQHYDYYWGSVDDGALEIKGIDEEVIYPLYMGGQYLRDIIESEVDYLPESRVTEFADSINGFGKTFSGQGYTPIETQWKDITVHKGTGIVISSSWYYEDRELSVQASNGVTLNATNIDLKSRQPYIAEEETTQEPLTPPEDGEETTPLPDENGEQNERPAIPMVWVAIIVIVISGITVTTILLKKRKFLRRVESKEET